MSALFLWSAGCDDSEAIFADTEQDLDDPDDPAHAHDGVLGPEDIAAVRQVYGPLVTWLDRGSILTSGPAVSSWTPGRLDTFARGPDNTLQHKSYNGTWSGWESLGGVLTSDPAAVSWGPGRIDVFARGGDNTLQHKWFNGKWSQWESLGGKLASGPAVASWGAGRLDVFARGTDNTLQHKWFNGTWSGWESLGGVLASDPAAVSWGPGRIDVFTRGADNALKHKWFNGGWSGWESLGGILTSAPAVSSWASGRLDVFARGLGNELSHKWYNGAWSGWESLQGTLTSSPEAVSWGPGRIDVFARGSANSMVQARFDGGWNSPPGEEPCLPFSSTPDVRFDALLAKMKVKAVSPSLTSSVPSGLSIAIVVDGELRHAGGVGTRAKAGHALAAAPVGADTLFRIASTSKWIHGTMVSSLVEDGLLDFDAPVTAVLPAYKEMNGKQNAMTLHHLLTMTSGLANDWGCSLHSVSESKSPKGCAAFSEGPETVLQSLFEPTRIASTPYSSFNTTSHTPGLAPFKYSNWGIMLSGRMAEAVGGSAQPDLVAARVFKPAHMCSATYDPSVMLDSGDYAVGSGSFDNDGDCPEPELGHDSKAPWEPDEWACRARDPNGGVRASAVDVGRFAAAFLADLKGAEIVLGMEAAHRMLCPGGGQVDGNCIGRVSTNGFAQSDTYGYTNFHHTTPSGHEVYSHAGGRAGYGALFWIVPKHNFAVVIMANDENTATSKAHWATSAIDCWLDGLNC